MERRDFFRLAAAAAGEIVLASCSDATGPVDNARPAIPNGMQFFAVKNSSTALPTGGALKHLRLDSSLDGTGEVFYGAVDTSGIPGLYAVQVDFSGNEAIPGAERTVARVGESLPDGLTITRLYQYDVNVNGGLALSLACASQSGPDRDVNAVYLDLSKTGLTRLLYDGLELPDGYQVKGRFTDVDLHTNDDLLAVALVRIPDLRSDGSVRRTAIRQAIIFFPASDPSQAHVVTTTRDLSGDTNGRGHFGLIDLDDNGLYVAQGTVGGTSNVSSAASGVAGQAAAPVPRTTVMRGTVYGGPPTTIVRNPFLSIMGASSPAGIAFYGPRLGGDGVSAFVMHESPTMLVLYYGETRVLQTGDMTPRGHTVHGIYPPVFGPMGEIYVVVNTDGGDELLVLNGNEIRTLLGYGDRLKDDRRSVIGLVIGHTTTATDAAGHLALVVCFSDTSAAVAVGVPA